MKVLKYKINSLAGVSLDPVDSDNMTNATVMKHLVGTLVRYSNGGQFLPYLVDNFKSEENGHLWHFTLRSDLQCEDGEKITAQGYINGLLKVLKMYAAQGPIPVIQDITGWQEFLKGQNLSGLRAVSSNKIEFKFDQVAGAGFLEYLSMPYYGYFCASNFNGDEWKSKLHITSSGPYKIDGDLKDNKEIDLRLVPAWPLTHEKSPQNVHFSCSLNEESWKGSDAVLQTSLPWGAKVPAGFTEIIGPPDAVRNIVLDPDGGSKFFSDLEVRRLLRDKILEVRSRIEFASHTARLADAFYPGSKPKLIGSALNTRKETTPLRIFIPKTMNDDAKFALKVLETSLKDLGWSYQLLTPGADGTVASDNRSKTKFDIRLSLVIAGSVVEPWVVEMMFGSNQGASYPDPSGKVTAYAKSLMKQSGFSLKEAGANVSQMIADDAAVIPVFHGHTTWYFSNDLDLSRIAGDLIVPSFEDIGFKD